MTRILASLALASCLLAAAPAAQAIQVQEQTNWCWAAVVQDVVGQHGTYVSQSEIVANAHGWPRTRPATMGEILALLDFYGVRAYRAGRPGSPNELYQALAGGFQLIAFVQPNDGPVGHVILLQGINPSSGYVMMSDPWTGATQSTPLEALYYAWRWGDTVVVGGSTW